MSNNMDFDYAEAFERNIGVFSLEEQEKLKKLKIAIAGCGGMGGQAAQQFVRLGVEGFNVADFDIYNVCNINNQFDSNTSTMGRNKAEVVSEHILEVNPNANVTVFNQGVTKENVNDFLSDVDIVVDAIDYNNQKDSLILHMAARKMNLFVFAPQAIGFGASVLVFDPKGVALEDFLGAAAINTNIIDVEKFSPYIPSYADPKVIKEIELGTGKYLPNIAVAQCLGIAMLTAEALAYILKNRKPTCVPNKFAIDLWDKVLIS